jgi:hypothetical protein
METLTRSFQRTGAALRRWAASGSLGADSSRELGRRLGSRC